MTLLYSTNNLILIADSAFVNSSVKVGAVQYIEQFVGRPLQNIFCLLHMIGGHSKIELALGVYKNYDKVHIF